MEPNWLFPTNFLAGCIKKAERNILKMSKRNFRKWTSDLDIDHTKINNVIYTPPVPVNLTRFYDIVDDLFSKIPLISLFSIMIYLCATKGEEKDERERI